MKNIIRFSLFVNCFLQINSSFAQMKLNMTLLSTWTDTTLPIGWTNGSFNDCWGYVDSTGKEYAILGSTAGTHIFNISNPASPVLVSFQAGRESSDKAVHRDFKTYKNYLYAVCDEGNSSLQIFDLKYLPDSTHKVYDSKSICKTAHDIFIDNHRLYFCGLKDNQDNPITFRVASLTNPENPTIISDLSNPPFGYVHDVNVRKDTAFLSCGSDGLFIYDYTNPTSPKLIQSITNYPEQGYNHSSWVSEDGKTLVFADETHGKGLKVYDISNMNNITLKSIFRSNLLNDPLQGSIPHNPFIVDNDKVFVSYYHDGVQCFDISNTAAPFQAGYYDTHIQNIDYSGYGPGCWGVYPYLPSKVIIATDILNGMFILDGSQLLGVNNHLTAEPNVLIFPNPTNDMLVINSLDANTNELSITLFNDIGKSILSLPSYKSGNPINVSKFSPGIYFLKVKGQNSFYSKKIIITN